MKPTARMLAPVFAVLLMVPGLLAALSACAMADCERAPMAPMAAMSAMAAGGHDCCPPAQAEFAADCCAVELAPPAAAPKAPETLGATALPSATVPELVPQDVRAPRRLAAGPPWRAPLDSLAQGCILRI